jgi:hypothetical protein
MRPWFLSFSASTIFIPCGYISFFDYKKKYGSHRRKVVQNAAADQLPAPRGAARRQVAGGNIHGI